MKDEIKEILNYLKDENEYYDETEHFIENKNNYPCVNHIDSNRKNNDVSNLEFCTHKQNTQWALKTGRFDNMKKLNSQRMKENRVWESRWNNA